MNTFTIRDIKVHPFASRQELMDYADEHKGILVAVNAEKTINAKPDLIQVINDNIGYCDGAGAVKAAHRKGHRQAIRIPGCELWHTIVSRHHSSRSFYLVGSTQEVITKTVSKLREEFPDINIVGYHNGFLSPDDRRELITDIAAKRPDFVFVAMGSPRQELLMAEMKAQHPQAVYQGLGGSFDLYCGNFKRAPRLVQKLGGEWLWRFVAQPSRIGRITPYLKFAYRLYTGKL